MNQTFKERQKQARFPIKDSEGKIIWKNIFKTDVLSIVFFIAILLILIGTREITMAGNDCLEKPCGYCEQSKTNYSDLTYQYPNLTGILEVKNESNILQTPS